MGSVAVGFRSRRWRVQTNGEKERDRGDTEPAAGEGKAPKGVRWRGDVLWTSRLARVKRRNIETQRTP